VLSFSKTPSFQAELLFVDSVKVAKELPAAFFVVGTVPDLEPKTDIERIARRCTEVLMARDGERKGLAIEMCYRPKIQTSFCTFAENAHRLESHTWN
jgi:hypothetical protein